MRQFALEDPRGFLGQFPAGALLDEVQRAPELLSYIQSEVDEHRAPGRRPNHAAVVYAQLCRRAFPGLPVILNTRGIILVTFAALEKGPPATSRGMEI